MNPNFDRNQITEDFTDLIRENPNPDTDLMYTKKFFDSISKNDNALKFDTKLSLGFYKLKECFSLTALFLPYIFCSIVDGGFLTYNHEMFQLSFFTGGISFIFMWIGFAEKCYYYRLDDKNIAVYEHQDQPLIAFKILRKIAWFGVGLCIFAFIWVGPMAFVGAGGSALLAFKLVNVKRDDCYGLINYDGILFIEEVEKENKIAIFHKYQAFCFRCDPIKIREEVTTQTIWCDKKDRSEVMAHIKKHINKEVEMSTSTSEKNETNFFEKIKSYNLTLNEVIIEKYEEQ